MSVIWSGVTAEGTVVPVQVTAEGKVVAVGDGPEGDYLKLTGGNLTGDLTLGTNKIKLDAALGIATFAGTINGVIVGQGGGSLSSNTAIGRSALSFNTTGTSNTAVGLNALYANTTGITNTALGYNALYYNTDGNSNTAVGRSALNDNTTGNYNTAFGQSALNRNTTGTRNTAVGQNAGYYIEGDSNTILGAYQGTTADKSLSNTVIISAGPTKRMQINSSGDVLIGADLPSSPSISLNASGAAIFTGDVVIGSRSKQWLIRESNGVAMLVEQNLLKQPREEKLRDLPNELDLIEAVLNEIMDKLRMTPPAGWPVWDGSDNA